ncbi:type II secretion system protein GspD, partial [Oligoflexia bacterium]|nr:type II secretion system protein GspD [Oligoflexia bacterium]
WKVIESALRRLDIMAPQVLIEATIAEVTLNDALSHGVQWYFSQGNHTSLFSNSSSSDTGFSSGFNYAFGIPKARVVLNALEQVTDVAIISSPALTVLDNQTAKLQVGDQVPITAQSAVSVVAANAPVVSNVEYKDTGVILSVTPRVNASGLVVLDITQEVSEVVPTTSSSLNSPTIRQRRVNSSIAVYSGMDIVLGGLISASRNKTDSGIPKIMDVPVLGELFKSDSKRDGARSELLVLLRPTVMANRADIRNVTNEIKSKMSGMARSFRR